MNNRVLSSSCVLCVCVCAVSECLLVVGRANLFSVFCGYSLMCLHDAIVSVNTDDRIDKPNAVIVQFFS